MGGRRDAFGTRARETSVTTVAVGERIAVADAQCFCGSENDSVAMPFDIAIEVAIDRRKGAVERQGAGRKLRSGCSQIARDTFDPVSPRKAFGCL